MLLLLQTFYPNYILKQPSSPYRFSIEWVKYTWHMVKTLQWTKQSLVTTLELQLPAQAQTCSFGMPAVRACLRGCLLDKFCFHLLRSTRVAARQLHTARPVFPFALSAVESWCPEETISIRKISLPSLPASQAKGSAFAFNDTIFKMIYWIIPVVQLKLNSRSSKNHEQK